MPKVPDRAGTLDNIPLYPTITSRDKKNMTKAVVRIEARHFNHWRLHQYPSNYHPEGKPYAEK